MDRNASRRGEGVRLSPCGYTDNARRRCDYCPGFTFAPARYAPRNVRLFARVLETGGVRLYGSIRCDRSVGYTVGVDQAAVGKAAECTARDVVQSLTVRQADELGAMVSYRNFDWFLGATTRVETAVIGDWLEEHGFDRKAAATGCLVAESRYETVSVRFGRTFAVGDAVNLYESRSRVATVAAIDAGGVTLGDSCRVLLYGRPDRVESLRESSRHMCFYACGLLGPAMDAATEPPEGD